MSSSIPSPTLSEMEFPTFDLPSPPPPPPPPPPPLPPAPHATASHPVAAPTPFADAIARAQLHTVRDCTNGHNSPLSADRKSQYPTDSIRLKTGLTTPKGDDILPKADYPSTHPIHVPKTCRAQLNVSFTPLHSCQCDSHTDCESHGYGPCVPSQSQPRAKDVESDRTQIHIDQAGEKDHVKKGTSKSKSKAKHPKERDQEGEPKIKMTRYLPPLKEEAFIGFLPPTAQETIALIQTQCPSLSSLPADQIHLQLRFDGKTSEVCKDILFRVMDDAWPDALHDVLHLVHVGVSPGVSGGVEAAPQFDSGPVPHTQQERKVHAEQETAKAQNGASCSKGEDIKVDLDVSRDQIGTPSLLHFMQIDSDGAKNDVPQSEVKQDTHMPLPGRNDEPHQTRSQVTRAGASVGEGALAETGGATREGGWVPLAWKADDTSDLDFTLTWDDLRAQGGGNDHGECQVEGSLGGPGGPLTGEFGGLADGVFVCLPSTGVTVTATSAHPTNTLPSAPCSYPATATATALGPTSLIGAGACALSAQRNGPTAMDVDTPRPRAQLSGMTWDDLVAEGALLGVEGSTDGNVSINRGNRRQGEEDRRIMLDYLL